MWPPAVAGSTSRDDSLLLAQPWYAVTAAGLYVSPPQLARVVVDAREHGSAGHSAVKLQGRTRRRMSHGGCYVPPGGTRARLIRPPARLKRTSAPTDQGGTRCEHLPS